MNDPRREASGFVGCALDKQRTLGMHTRLPVPASDRVYDKRAAKEKYSPVSVPLNDLHEIHPDLSRMQEHRQLRFLGQYELFLEEFSLSSMKHARSVGARDAIQYLNNDSRNIQQHKASHKEESGALWSASGAEPGYALGSIPTPCSPGPPPLRNSSGSMLTLCQ